MVMTDEKPDLLLPEIDNPVEEESKNLTHIESSTVSIEQGQQCLVDNASIEDREENLMVVTDEKPDLLLPEIDNLVVEESENLTQIESCTVSIEQGQQCLVDNASIEDREENLMVVTDEKPDLLQPEIDDSVVEESENLTQIESSTVSMEQGQQCLVDNASIEEREENLMVVIDEKPKCVIGTVVI